MRISVFTPSFNKGRLALEAIESVLTQSFGDFEYWILENSTDPVTRNMVYERSQTDSRIKYEEIDIPDEIRKDYYPTAYLLNKYYQRANGEYIFYLSDDDLVCPEGFKRCMDYFDRSVADVAYFSLKVTEENDKGEFAYLTQKSADFAYGINSMRQQVDCMLDGGQVIHKTDCLKHIEQPFFPPDWDSAAHVDGLFLEKLAHQYTFYPIVGDFVVEHRRTLQSTFIKPGR